MPERGALQLAACTVCDVLDPGGRASCPICGGELAPRALSGRGTLLSWTLVRRPPAGFDADGPYAVALVELDEGVRVTARLDRLDCEPAIGARVRVSGAAGAVPSVTVDAFTDAT